MWRSKNQEPLAWLSWQETLSLIQSFISFVEKLMANSGISHVYEIFSDGSGVFHG